MSTPDILNVLPVEGAAMEEDLSFELGFNSHENLFDIFSLSNYQIYLK